ncbi:diacylglycerol kinase family protein [Bacillus sp. FJAT-47783]|uniref:diacylglycerol kinase family protein n=1 Tax=Bacillus sp. FJAT-47783 TaxID=2922712 RepID=UPI001FABBA4E|nr:diacylglycerol kinase family protein [Bacillus sp. FJAT-47783]
MASIDPFKSNFKRFVHSFRFAWHGIVATIKSEVNFRFHLLATVIVIMAGIYFHIRLFEWMMIVFLIGGMLALELMNTAIERVVDLVTQQHHPLAKKAKDAGAAAVFVFAVVSVIIGLCIFLPKLTFL